MKQEIFIVYQEDLDSDQIVGIFSNMKSAYECRMAGRKAGRARWVHGYCVDDSYILEQDFYLVDYEEDHP